MAFCFALLGSFFFSFLLWLREEGFIRCGGNEEADTCFQSPSYHLPVLFPLISVDEESIDTQVNSLRLRLNAQAPSSNTQSKQDIRNLKSHDSHALAQAKQVEMNRMGRAMGIGAGYVEGKAFDRQNAEVERAEK